jgi:hypothetical protein
MAKPMLILTRKQNESLIIGDDIKITILDPNGSFTPIRDFVADTFQTSRMAAAGEFGH